MMNKKLTNKGFTLAELLVVVAIIAILVAVSIPIFSGKLNAAKKATDEANLRACKAVVMQDVLNEEFPTERWTVNELTGTAGAAYDAEKGILVPVTNLFTVKGYAQGSKIKGYSNYEGGLCESQYYLAEEGRVMQVQVVFKAEPMSVDIVWLATSN